MFSSTQLELGKLGYGGLYAAPATFMYLLTTEPRIPFRVPYVYTFDSDIDLIILLIISLYSALWLHRAGLLIFGDEAGLLSTRSKEITRKHLTYFATGVNPYNLPDTSSTWRLMSEAVSSGSTNWLVFLRYVPVGLFMGYILVAFGWLSVTLLFGSSNLVGGVLWLVLFVWLFEDRITGYLPKYIPSESVDGFDEASYVKTYTELQNRVEDNSKQPRIRSKGHSRPSHRHRTE